MKYPLIDERDAPPRPTNPLSKRMAAVTDLLQSLAPGNAARIEPEASETIRGVNVSVSRAAKRLVLDVAMWDHDGAVFVQLGTEPSRRQRRASSIGS